MQNYMLFCEIYNSMSQEYYCNYLKVKNEKNDIYYFQSKLSNAIAAIVFQALAVESYINVFGVYNLGKKFNDHYERISTLSKLIIICRAITGKEFPEGKCQDGIKDLIKKRDKLVHYKTKSIDFKKEDNKAYIKFMKDHVTFVFDDIDEQIKLYMQLKQILKDLVGSPYDIFQQQCMDSFKEIPKTVVEMFYSTQKEE